MNPAAGAAALCLLALAGAAQAEIYTCTDARGRRLTSDRPIAECLDREQALRNSDGSVRRIVPPSLTQEEKAAQEEARRRRQIEESSQKDLARHDRNLLSRFPTEAEHRRARQTALEPLRLALTNNEKRLADLQRERRKLEEEAEFYKGRTLPRPLQSRLDDNQASREAQHTSMQSHEAEMARIGALYDEEFARLQRLWNGAKPGSLGPVTNGAAATR